LRALFSRFADVFRTGLARRQYSVEHFASAYVVAACSSILPAFLPAADCSYAPALFHRWIL